MIAIFLHIYYPASLPELLQALQPLRHEENYLLINLVQDTHLTMPDLSAQKNIIAVRSTNKGKDIGGKLVLLDLYLRLGIKSDYMIFLHDKKSPHSAVGSFWKQELYKIIDEKYIAGIQSIFKRKGKVGIVGSKIFIRNEWLKPGKRFDTPNHDILLSLLSRYNMSVSDFSFMAGTMFWVRSSVYTSFFLQHPPLQIRAGLEDGNVLDNEAGTFTHAWERLLSWIAAAQGYKLQGV